jgi:hypothetical protein
LIYEENKEKKQSVKSGNNPDPEPRQTQKPVDESANEASQHPEEQLKFWVTMKTRITSSLYQ